MNIQKSNPCKEKSKKKQKKFFYFFSVTFRKLLELISKQLRNDISFNQDIIEELCQYFQTTIPIMNCTSPIRVS
jgi:hypothetical protein